MHATPPRQLLLHHFATVGQAVASPARLELLDLLAQGTKTVAMLARQAGLSVANASAHLRVLRQACLVSARRDGQHVRYALEGPGVRAFVRCLEDLAVERVAAARQLARDYFEAPEGLDPVDARTLRHRLARGDVTILDVRPGDEYGSGHITGALSIPLPDLARRLRELPRGREIVAYCRGPYCVLAVRAVEILRSRGYRARRLDVGMPEWSRRRYPVSPQEGKTA